VGIWGILWIVVWRTVNARQWWGKNKEKEVKKDADKGSDSAREAETKRKDTAYPPI
jgi:hypothetical protein